MQKIVIFNSSPRLRGAVSQILEKLMQGARDASSEVVLYNLNHANIRGCQGCMYCKKKNLPICCQKDYLAPMYADIAAADTIIIGSPIYMFHISGQLQTWVNRLFPFADMQHTPLAPGKKLITVYSQGASVPQAFQGAMDYLKGIMDIMGWEEIHRIVNTDCLPAAQPAHVPDSILQQAYELGKTLS